MINVDIFDSETKAKAARATYEEMGRRTEIFGESLGVTVDDRRVDPAVNIYADGRKVWVVVVE